MWSAATVCVNNDLATSKPRIAVWSADNEFPSWVNVIFGVTCDEMLGDNGLNNVFDYVFFNALLCDCAAIIVKLIVLCRR